MKEICLVVPTIREKCFTDFLQRWTTIGLFEHVDLIVMEDNPVASIAIPDSFRGRCETYHYSWVDIEDKLGSKSWIIPRRSDTVRSFGYLMAARLGYKYTMTLDDDCYPPTAEVDGLSYDGRGFVENHLLQLTKRSRWHNTLNSVIPRGVPYFKRGTFDNVMVNHGLWTNVIDYDAPHQLVAPAVEKFSFDNRIVPNGMYFPMCGMNLMWKTEVTVLMYHLLMGCMRPGLGQDGKELKKLPFDRFGDIWCGIIMKKILDITGNSVSTGMPYIRHERASNPFTNLKKEANGIEVNEQFWELIDKFNVIPSTLEFEGIKKYALIYHQMGAHVRLIRHVIPEYNEYFVNLGDAMQLWADLFKENG